MPSEYVVKLGARGQVVIPASVRRLLGLEAGEAVVFSVDEERHVTVAPAVVVARRTRGPVRRYSDAEVAQLLIDSAYTPEEIKDAEARIAQMGLNPKAFQRHEPAS